MAHHDHQSSAMQPGKGHFQVAHEWLTGRVEDPRRLDPLLEDLVALSYADPGSRNNGTVVSGSRCLRRLVTVLSPAAIKLIRTG